MNRRQRRAARQAGGAVAATHVPVFGPADRIIALVPIAEVRHYATAPNAKLVKTRGGEVVRIQLRTLSDDTAMVVHRGNPRKYSHHNETDDNPVNVWTLRKIAPPTADGEAFVQRIFRASVLDNLKRAA